jgi:hypothetical protein
VYVTWELRVDGSGTVVRLYGHETDARATSEDLEDAWLPVLSLLLAQLERRGSLTEKSANGKEKRCP